MKLPVEIFTANRFDISEMVICLSIDLKLIGHLTTVMFFMHTEFHRDFSKKSFEILAF